MSATQQHYVEQEFKKVKVQIQGHTLDVQN